MGRSRGGLVRAAFVAAVVSGAPSTIHALATGRDPLEATIAAGSIVLPDETDPATLLIAAVPLHLAISLWWTAVLARVLPRKGAVLWGAAYGALIGLFDLKVIGRRYPRLAALPFVPQMLDHALFGAVARYQLSNRDQLRLRRSSPG
jgi:hypothetical protein